MGLSNRKSNELYTKLFEDCLLNFDNISSIVKDDQLQKSDKKVKSPEFLLSKQKQIIESFTGKTYFTFLEELYEGYLFSGDLIDAFRILRLMGEQFVGNSLVRLKIFQFFLRIGLLRKAESFLLSIISAIKCADELMTLYVFLLFEMRKYRESLLVYLVSSYFHL